MEKNLELGQVVATPACLDAIGEEGIGLALALHRRCHWGEVDEEDRATNDEAHRVGTRILSQWTVRGEKFWIITEADRSSTTALLPSEY